MKLATLLTLAALLGSSLGALPVGTRRDAAATTTGGPGATTGPLGGIGGTGGFTTSTCNDGSTCRSDNTTCVAECSDDAGVTADGGFTGVFEEETCCGFQNYPGMIYIGNTHVDEDQEAAHMVEAIALGTTNYVTETDLSAVVTAMNSPTGPKWVVFPEQQHTQYVDTLTNAQENDILAFVNGGGVILHAYNGKKASTSGSTANTFLSTIFSYAIGYHSPSHKKKPFKVDATTVGTCLELAPAKLNYNDDCAPNPTADLTAIGGAASVYYKTDDGEGTSVWGIRQGNGMVLGISYDYFRTINKTNRWNRMLVKLLAHGSCPETADVDE